MSMMNSNSKESISLVLNEVLPAKNPEIAWCYLFLPALLGYLYLLANYINEKPETGRIIILDKSLDKIFPPSAKIEIIASGLSFADGPLWIDDKDTSNSFLLFSDTRKNRIMRWEDGKGLFTIGKSLYMDKSGCRGNETECKKLEFPGSAGLIRMLPVSSSVDVVVCQRGDRSVTLIYENGSRVILASKYNGDQLSSPRDFAWSREGHLVFIDDVEEGERNRRSTCFSECDNSAVISNNSGIYFIHRNDILQTIATKQPTNNVKLLVGNLPSTRGVAFSHDFMTLFVSSAGPHDASLYAFSVAKNGSLHDRKLLISNNITLDTDLKDSLSDPNGSVGGLKVDSVGNIYAIFPRGLIIASSEGKLLGALNINKTLTNLAFDNSGFLYITAIDSVLRVKTRAKAPSWTLV